MDIWKPSGKKGNSELSSPCPTSTSKRRALKQSFALFQQRSLGENIKQREGETSSLTTKYHEEGAKKGREDLQERKNRRDEVHRLWSREK